MSRERAESEAVAGPLLSYAAKRAGEYNDDGFRVEARSSSTDTVGSTYTDTGPDLTSLEGTRLYFTRKSSCPRVSSFLLLSKMHGESSPLPPIFTSRCSIRLLLSFLFAL
jgi:hypothetical protein